MPRACYSAAFRRECSWDVPPETTSLQSASWSSWATPRKGGEDDDDPTAVATPSSQAAAEGEGNNAASVEVALLANARSAEVAPREGVSLAAQGGSANSEQNGGSSAVVMSSPDEGGGAVSVGAAAAGDEEAFSGDSADSSGTYTSGSQSSAAIQVWSSLKEMHSILVLCRMISKGFSRFHKYTILV